jgi:RNA polymerase sigma factor (sigma-70 family)
MSKPVNKGGNAAELILRLGSNDGQALKDIYLENYSKTAQYILANNGTADDAKDIYQEAFIAVWRNIQLDKISFATRDDMQAYLYKTAQYKWIDKLRKDKREKTGSLNELDIPDEDHVLQMDNEDEIYLEKVKQHFAVMGEPCKELLQRFYFLKQRLGEIARYFSWTDATAKNNKYRCIQKLRTMILAK